MISEQRVMIDDGDLDARVEGRSCLSGGVRVVAARPKRIGRHEQEHGTIMPTGFSSSPG